MTQPRQSHDRCASTSCERNGTHIRVLIAVPADAAGTIDIHRIADDLAISIGRIIVVIAPTICDLDEHTHRLQTSARIQEWELVSADGMHHRILNTLTATSKAIR
jgi:hypothetical protein